MKPDLKLLRLELFANADFTGLFVAEDTDDPIYVKSRSELLLNLGGVPIFLSSKLQYKIAFSNLKVECIDLL